jgi:hypothetical protein
MEQEWNIFMEYGNRTSSFMSMYPGLEQIQIEKGQARGICFKNQIVLATEPHCVEHARADEIVKLKNSHQKKITLLPIGEKLAGMLQNQGFSVWQIGSEPIFELSKYFKSNPLNFLPLGKTLKKRGANLVEVSSSELDLYRKSLQQIHEEWKKSKIIELGFLNQVDPFFKFELKRCFLLKIHDEIQAFMTAVPLFYQGEILGYYFNDIIRSSKARAGTNELLIVEAMRVLHIEGVSEVRLGMAPLSRIKKNGPASSFLNFLFEHHTLGYNFSGHYQFKYKLNPTRWDDLFLASSGNGFIQSLKYAIEAHFPKGLWHLAQTMISNEWGRYLELGQRVKRMMQIEKGEEIYLASFKDTVRKTRWTVTFMSLFILLHILKVNHPYFSELFVQSAYIPGAVTVKGLFIAPLFHNHLFHLFGDQLCFFLFGAYIEAVLGVRHFMALAAAGLFLSNPLTHGLVEILLPYYPDLYHNHFLLEKDYGSSNAVFTFVGGMGGAFKNKAWLIVPFLIYAVFIAISLESFLALHHILALYMGYCMVLAASGLRAHFPGPKTTL